LLAGLVGILGILAGIIAPCAPPRQFRPTGGAP
jgi:hypothetical protein